MTKSEYDEQKYCLSALRRVTRGLSYPSERDAPFSAFYWRREALSPGRNPQYGDIESLVVLEYVKILMANATPEAVIDEFFALEGLSATEARRFRTLRDTLTHWLFLPRVVRTRIDGATWDVFILGETDQKNYAGIKTRIVES